MFKTLEFQSDNCNATRHVTVEVQVDDDDAPWHQLARVTTNGRQLLSFSSIPIQARSGKRIRIRFILATDNVAQGPRVILPYHLHSTFRPRKPRRLEFIVKIGSGQPLVNGGRENRTTTDQLDILEGLRNEDWPLLLKEDENGDGVLTEHHIFIHELEFWQAISHPYNVGEQLMLYRIVAIQSII